MKFRFCRRILDISGQELLRFTGGSNDELWEIRTKTRWLLPEGEIWILMCLLDFID